jgi:hypothetical protein
MKPFCFWGDNGEFGKDYTKIVNFLPSTKDLIGVGYVNRLLTHIGNPKGNHYSLDLNTIENFYGTKLVSQARKEEILRIFKKRPFSINEIFVETTTVFQKYSLDQIFSLLIRHAYLGNFAELLIAGKNWMCSHTHTINRFDVEQCDNKWFFPLFKEVPWKLSWRTSNAVGIAQSMGKQNL